MLIIVAVSQYGYKIYLLSIATFLHWLANPLGFWPPSAGLLPPLFVFLIKKPIHFVLVQQITLINGANWHITHTRP